MDRLTEKDFSFKCPMSWNEMKETANGRYCSKCRKEVFDLTNCSTDEVRALQEKHGSLCGTVRLAQAAAVALSLSAAACQENGRTMGKVTRTTGTPSPIPSTTVNPGTSDGANDLPQQNPTQKPPKQPQLMGEICPPPKADPPKQDAPAQVPVDPVELIEKHMILGKICPQPIPNEEIKPPGRGIDI